MQIWMILAGVIVGGLGICLLIRSIRRGRSCCGTHEADGGRPRSADRDLSHYPFRYIAKVEGMVCGHCVRNVERAFAAAEMYASAALESKSVRLYAKRQITRREAADILDHAGYTLIEFEEETQ